MNKEIELCGIGNSLVDLQFNMSDEELLQINIPKGEMRLSSIDEQKILLQKMVDKNHHKCSGGSAANTIIAFSQLGGKAGYMSMLGNDDLGAFYMQEFNELGIELSAKQLEDNITGTCAVFITPDSERTMNTCLAASSFFRSEDIQESLIERSKWIYLEGYLFSVKESSKAVFKAIDFAKKHNTKISLTFSDPFITANFREQVLEAAKQSDLLFCNENEAMSFTKTSSIDEAIVELGILAPNFVVTKGAQGSIVKWNNELINIKPSEAVPVDSTGAGDMYAAGFMYGIINSGSALKAGRLASVAAAKIVSQYGARYDGNMKELKLGII